MKKIITFLLSISVIMILAGCSIGKSEQVKITEKILEKAAVERNLKGVEKHLTKDIQKKLGSIYENSDSLNEEQTSEEGVKFAEKIREISGKTKFKVEETDTPNVVKVTIDYLDISKPFKQALENYMATAFLEAFSEDEMNEDELERKLWEELDMRLSNFDQELSSVTGNIELSEKSGDLVIIHIDDNVTNAINLGIQNIYE